MVFRAVRTSDSRAVIIKISNSEYPSARQIARYRREYEITDNLDPEATVPPLAIEVHGNGLALVLEDTGAIALDQYFRKNPPDVITLLNCFSRLADALQKIHAAGVIHKDIKPSNIVVDPDGRRMRFIDLGISSRLPREKSFLRSPQRLEGTLNYIAPEQTGRMNRGIDFRTDLYSFGVTMYEMFTGRLPFESADAPELVHAHLALQPPTPLDVKPDLPEMISRIIMKLLSKTPEDRYQSAAGLAADLKSCAEQLSTSGQIKTFQPGRYDRSDQFQIPEKLYGRETEIASLMRSFQAAREGRSALLMVSGHSGIGKSVLVNEIHQPIAEERGYFTSGKFDQYKRDLPYSALLQGFEGLIQQILAEPPERIAIWKTRLLDALGANGQVIIEVIPQLELIIGQQPPVAELPPAESQNRFQINFQNFIRVFATREHPLVLFLDDLQWADSASLKLLEALITDVDSKHMLMIGAYRDNEVDEGHPLSSALQRIDQAGVSIENIFLSSLRLEHIRHLLADTFLRPEGEVGELAALVIEKTDGNPFFVIEFLRNLYRERLVDFNEGWQWDMEGIRRLAITDNVVDLVSGRIRDLAPAAQEILKVAACLGNRFDLDELMMVSGKTAAEVSRDLEESLNNGLILPGDEDYKYIGQESDSADHHQHIYFDFLHDRVQQAAYSLIPEAARTELHLNIGRSLLDKIPEGERDEKIIDIVAHLNLGAELIEAENEKLQLASLNSRAADRAKSSAAHKGALELYGHSIAYMPANIWESDYDLAYHAHLERAEMEYANLEFASGEQSLAFVREKARTDRDRARVFSLQVTIYAAQGRFTEAIEAGLEGLKLLGIDIPLEAVPVQLRGEIEDLADLPETKDEDRVAAMRILAQLVISAFFSNSPYTPSLIFTMVQQSQDLGNSPYSAWGYLTYGIILCAMRDYDAGYRFGRLALDVQEKYQSTEFRGRVFAFYAIYIHCWKHHVDEINEYLQEGHESAMQAADLYFAAASLLFVGMGKFTGGGVESLTNSLGRLEEYKSTMHKTGTQPIIEQNEFYEQCMLNLRGRSENRLDLVGEAFDETKMLPIFIETNNVISTWAVYHLKALLALIFEEFDRALENSELAMSYTATMEGVALHIPLELLHNTLTHAIACGKDGVSSEKREEHLARIRENTERLENLAGHNPTSYTHHYHLARAELARLEGDRDRAESLYDQAIDSARQNGFLMIECLAQDAAARYYLALGKTRFAAVYLKDAHYAYTRWGAKARVEDLEARYPEQLASRWQTSQATTTATFTNTFTVETHGSALDVSSAMKAAQVISGELVLDRLLDQLVRIVLENAGAERVLLFLKRENDLYIEAEGLADGESTRLIRKNVEAYEQFPRAIVNYVMRSREHVLLDDAPNEGIFRRDPYVQEKRPRSVLCFPILYRNELTGLLYLENNMTVGAFTQDRLESLNLLSGQIAISLEHAQLYSSLEEKVLERTRELRETQARLVDLEKDATERQMAGGFAHEMRNALAGSRLILEQALGMTGEPPYESMNLGNSRMLKDTYLSLREVLPGDNQKNVLEKYKKIFRNEERLDQILNIVYNATSRGLKITQQIMTYSKIGQEETGAEPLNLVHLLERFLRDHREEFAGRDIAITADITETELPLSGFENHFFSVISNLILNARDALLDARLPDDREKTVHVRASREGDDCLIEVQDNGIGIKPDILPRIYDAFFSTKPETGTGLGLGTVKKIVQLYRGQIDVESQPGGGATFRVRLPLALKEPAAS